MNRSGSTSHRIYNFLVILGLALIPLPAFSNPTFEISELYPNPYKLLNHSFINKDDVVKGFEESISRYLEVNCDSDSKLKFCKRKDSINKYTQFKTTLLENAEAGQLVLNKTQFFLGSLLSQNFEVDVLISESQAESLIQNVIDYLLVRNELSQNLFLAHQEIFGMNNIKGIYGRTTVLPATYAVSHSTNMIESLARYLDIADCHQDNLLCGYFLNQLYIDYQNINKSYDDTVLIPLNTAYETILSLSEEDKNILIERTWITEIYKDFDTKDFRHFFENLLYSSGHLNDEEQIFKENVFKAIATKNTINKTKENIQKKSEKWKSQSDKLLSKNTNVILNISHKKELLELLIKEIRDQKINTIDKLNTLDTEVGDEIYSLDY